MTPRCGLPLIGIIAGAVTLLLAPGLREVQAADSPGATSLVAPLESTPRLTSSFGEYREGHYHGGLDYSTGGAQGLAVHAPASGWVYRLRASGVGYGRAIYFRMDDGRTAVFAHLQRFVPPLEEVLAGEQDRLGRFEVDLYPSPGTLRFAAGEVLAFTGATGAGPPHLHAEIRVDPGANVAVDPRGAGWPVPDTVPPTLGRLLVEPAHAGVLVNGGIDPVVLNAGTAQADLDTLEINGPVRCWIETRDRTSPDSGVLAPSLLETFIDGVPWSRVSWERFDWRWPGEVEWTFLESAARSRGERWVRLDPPPGSRQPVHRLLGAFRFLGEGLSPRLHELRIRVSDPAGRTAETRVVVRAVEMTSPGTEAGSAPAMGSDAAPVVVSRGTFLELNGVGDRLTPGEEEQVVLFQPLGESDSRSAIPVPVKPVSRREPHRATTGGPGAGSGGVWTVPTRGGPSPRVARLIARTAGDVPWETVLDLGPVRLVVPRGAVYEDLWVVPVVGEGLAEPGGDEPELTAVSAAVRLTPWATPLRERVRVEFSLPPGQDRRGVGIYSRRGEAWSYEGADSTSRGFSTGIRNLEELALFRDRVPPQIRFLVAGDGTVEPARPRLVARIVETGSGVTWRTLTMLLDGEEILAEWDPEARDFTAILRERLEPGEHRLQVIARDRAGNRSEVLRMFTVSSGD